MSRTIDLEKIERKTTRSNYEDGLFDIQLGMLLLATGVLHLVFPDWSGTTIQRMGLWSGIAVAGLVLWAVGKRFISLPRMGRVKPGPAGRARLRKITTFMSITFLLTVAVVAVTALSGSGRLGLARPISLGEWAVPAGVAIFLVLLFGVLAYFLAYERLALIGLFFALPWLIVEAVERTTGVDISAAAFLSASGIVLLMGVITFIHFLQRNPVPADSTLPGTQ